MRRTSASGGAEREGLGSRIGSGTARALPASRGPNAGFVCELTKPSGKLAGMRLDHGGLLVSDVERAVRFYVDALGLERVPRPPTFDTPGAWLRVGADHQIHLIGETEDGRAREMNPGLDAAEIAIGYGNHLALVVDDLDA